MKSARTLLLQAGDARYAVPAEQVLAVHDDIAIERIPGTRAWFLGLAVVDGRLLPATDLAAFLRDEPGTGGASTARCLLQVHETLGNAALAVDSVQAIPDAAVSAQSDATITLNDDVWPLLDLATLVRSPEFLDIGEALA